MHVPHYLTALPILANGPLLKNDLSPNEGANGGTQFPVNYYFFGQISVNYYFVANSQFTANFV